jgi:hypothetical protein
MELGNEKPNSGVTADADAVATLIAATMSAKASPSFRPLIFIEDLILSCPFVGCDADLKSCVASPRLSSSRGPFADREEIP